MTDYSELIKKLRGLHRDPRPASAEWLFENQVALYDAADAIEALQAEQKKTVTQIFGEELQEWEEYCTGLMNRIRELKAQLPKRGEWIWDDKRCIYVCSVCGSPKVRENMDRQIIKEQAYCYSCGAKMEVQDGQQDLI